MEDDEGGNMEAGNVEAGMGEPEPEQTEETAQVSRRMSQLESINVYGLMEDINDKLKILHYEQNFCKGREFKPLNRTYFALPGKASEQFPYFSTLVSWLLKEMEVNFIEWNEFDDPNAISNNIMEQLKALGFSAEFPVSKLRHGSGDAVCLALNFLLDQTLRFKSFQVQSPVYVNPGYAEEAAVDEAAEIDDEDDDIDEDVADDESGIFDANEYFHPKQDMDAEAKADTEILESKVDPAEWKLELERVGPKLKFRANPASKEWRTHIEQSQKHEKMISSQFPDCKVALDKIKQELRSAIDRISQKERQINKDFDHLGGEFRENQKRLDQIQENYDGLSKSVAELTQTLASKTDSVDMIKSQMSDRNQSLTDTSPLGKIQGALSELRKEVAAMELRIGVVGQTLLQSKMKMHVRDVQSAGQKRQNYEERF